MERGNFLFAGSASIDGHQPLTGGAWTAADIRRRFIGLAPGPDRGSGASRGDHELNPGMRPMTELRDAAVLVPLVDHGNALNILLTRRTAHLSRHAGQIAFPGGRVDEGDADAVATALRETEEEIGLNRDRIEPIGQLDRYVTRTGFTVTPVVAIVHPPFTLNLHAEEVAASFEVPLEFILDPANRERHSAEYQGVQRHFYAIPFGKHYIWGATAGMLVNLAETLASENLAAQTVAAQTVAG